ncbi:acyl-CoA N-acyltransferase [Dichotomocladium elegans]|nr:acyl-CoA N-acyltransferase [Dichotomocladium elegans]
MALNYQNPELTIITTEKDFEKVLQIRIKVFVDEQGYPLITETDEYHDPESTHWLLTAERNGERVPIGTIRMYPYIGKTVKLSRLALLPEARGLGYGQLLVRSLCSEAHARGLEGIAADSQVEKRAFYEKLGFVVEEGDEEPYDWDGAPHIKMWKRSLP